MKDLLKADSDRAVEEANEDEEQQSVSREQLFSICTPGGSMAPSTVDPFEQDVIAIDKKLADIECKRVRGDHRNEAKDIQDMAGDTTEQDGHWQRQGVQA